MYIAFSFNKGYLHVEPKLLRFLILGNGLDL